MGCIERYKSGLPGKYRVEIPIGNYDETIKCIIIKGEMDGPWILVDAGVHSAEYNGIKAVMELSQSLDHHKVHGGIILIPLINENGFQHRAGSNVFADGKNLNRVFPGKEFGSLADVMAYTISTQIFPYVDYVVDIHSGDAYEQLTPFAFVLGGCNQQVNDGSTMLSQWIDVKYLAKSMLTSGGLYNSAGALGIPSILIERGGMNDWNDAWVNQDKADVINILQGLHILDGKAVTYDHILFEQVEYVRAPKSGLWLTNVFAGQTIVKDQLLGTITDPYGDPLSKIIAKNDGVVLYQTHSLNAIEKGALIAYGIHHE